ncbi:MAG: hypothetical protein Pg6C_09190 [Treponemataceae bacterium]|nr:MAG: hypothetical protein Pg6C_09190 [Treponemataceae bacterium]
MAEVQAAYPRGLDFEQVWAALMENREQIRETERHLDRTSAIVEEVARKIEATAEQARVTDKRVGELTGRFGEVVEYMIVPNLVAKFRELGFEFTRAGPDVKIADREHDIHAEVDAFLENGDKVMIVEIKSKPNTDDVKDHVEKMEKLRRYADLKGDGRKYLGAIAGVVVGESVANYALKNGFYVIEPSGDTFNIIEPKGIYRPREW